MESTVFNPEFVNPDLKKFEENFKLNIASTQEYLTLYENESQSIPVMISLDTKSIVERTT